MRSTSRGSAPRFDNGRILAVLLAVFIVFSGLVPAGYCEGSERDGESPAVRSYSAAALTGRVALLTALRGQLGSEGEIIGSADGQFYTQWYIGGEYANGWDKDTPWCGAFVSWAVRQPEVTLYLEDFTPFASVEKGMSSFQDDTNGSWLEAGQRALPGDLVFFDWDEEGGEDHGKPDHVGVVQRTDPRTGEIFTIEGNNEGSVKECSYPQNDPRILGFGVLRWK